MGWADLLGIGIVIAVGAIIYSKIKKQSVSETIEDIKELINPIKNG